jgi:peptide chain release factor 1
MKEETLQKDMAIGKGVKYASYIVEGENIFKHLKYESGVHKVQRVPETEKAGRIHSSTCVVLIMP